MRSAKYQPESFATRTIAHAIGSLTLLLAGCGMESGSTPAVDVTPATITLPLVVKANPVFAEPASVACNPGTLPTNACQLLTSTFGDYQLSTLALDDSAQYALMSMGVVKHTIFEGGGNYWTGPNYVDSSISYRSSVPAVLVGKGGFQIGGDLYRRPSTDSKYGYILDGVKTVGPNLLVSAADDVAQIWPVDGIEVMSLSYSANSTTQIITPSQNVEDWGYSRTESDSAVLYVGRLADWSGAPTEPLVTYEGILTAYAGDGSIINASQIRSITGSCAVKLTLNTETGVLEMNRVDCTNTDILAPYRLQVSGLVLMVSGSKIRLDGVGANWTLEGTPFLRYITPPTQPLPGISVTGSASDIRGGVFGAGGRTIQLLAISPNGYFTVSASRN